MKPRMPNSPPPTPMMTLSLSASGARVIEYAAFISATLIFQLSLPVFASTDNR